MSPAVSQTKGAFVQDGGADRPERWLARDDEWKAMDRRLLVFELGTRTCIRKSIGGLLRTDPLQKRLQLPLGGLYILIPKIRHVKTEIRRIDLGPRAIVVP